MGKERDRGEGSTSSPGPTGDFILQYLNINESCGSNKFNEPVTSHYHPLLFYERQHQILPLPITAVRGWGGPVGGIIWRRRDRGNLIAG